MTSHSDGSGKNILGKGLDEALPTEIELDGVSRRTFLSVAGATAALAGAGLSGCVRKPTTKIVPYATRPEEIIEGIPLHYASAYAEGAAVTGIVVESREGRPTKIAGNRAHPDSLGGTSAAVQASVLDLYDLDRSTLPVQSTAEGSPTLPWKDAWSALDDLSAKNKNAAFILPSVMSPSTRRLLRLAKAAFPKARFFRADILWPANAMAASEALAEDGSYALSHFDKADVVASFDFDFLGSDPDSVRATKGFSKKRRVTRPGQPMNRLYTFEPSFTPTGAMADHRARLKAGDIGKALIQLAQDLNQQGIAIEASLLAALPTVLIDVKAQKAITALAKDLKQNRDGALVVVGPRQPAWVHSLAYAINAALETEAQTWHKNRLFFPMESMQDFAGSIDSFDIVYALETDPVYGSAGALKLADAFAPGSRKFKLVHAGLHRDATGKVADLHLPISHYLEAWGDQQALSGATSIVQPLIEPLHYTPSALEILARVVTRQPLKGHDIVRETWSLDTKSWENWLNDGFRWVDMDAVEADFAKAQPLIEEGAKAKTADFEILFEPDPNARDGRFANNGWMRELPHPMSKVTWDNAAIMNAKTANGLSNGDLVNLEVDGRSVQSPIQIVPGVADNVVVLTLGHGRVDYGQVAAQHGTNIYPLLHADLDSGWFKPGKMTTAGGQIELAPVQAYADSQTPRLKSGYGPHPTPDTFGIGMENPVQAALDGRQGNLFEPRKMALMATAAQYEANPKFAIEIGERTMPQHNIKSWMYPERPGEVELPGGTTADDIYLNGVHQWGMSIDLNACTACNACSIACNAENNIVVIGKEQILFGRDMHWIRLDRYYSGQDDDDVQAIMQPLGCQHCETAPCESVCPVKATAHSNEGLNDMVYNRCIGTRYCANNCPFKVRRFNWFNFNLDLHPLEQMQKNPDVTVRFRGVMEKCTYCVQRINRAKIQAKIQGDGRVRDGDFQVACEEICPADAIVFGDLRDPESAVSKAKSEPRTYQLLPELNLRTRTSYLAKLKNPNPDLV